MKELVQEITSHVESIDLEVTSNFDAALHTTSLPPQDFGAQPVGDVQTLLPLVAQLAVDASNQSVVETDPAAQS